ncbi:hypothetical protein F2Q68_00006435 [Brassica cretica]|uniref:Uncharacterized protein n=1 Tax=Brassica cretica TaxID=69181 RepID=A0A8S9JE78_BRACR|nr:hypothetical protein F2Q68_00006435 [Brassica cretica]
MCKGCCGKATPYFNPVTEEIRWIDRTASCQDLSFIASPEVTLEANKYSCVSCEKDETITTMR